MKLFALFALALLGAMAAATPSHAAYPGRNGRIAFVRDGDIWTIWPSGKGLRRVTHAVGDDYDRDPAWSPDGRRLAFTRSILIDASRWDRSFHDTIQVTRPPDSAPREVARTASSPTWSPNGRWIAFAPTTGGIAVVRRTGTDRRTLLPAPGAPVSFGEPKWSPDGRRIAFSVSNGVLVTETGVSIDFVVGLVDPVTGAISQIPAVADGEGSVDWSPNGRRLVYTAWRAHGGPFDVAVMSPDGTDRRMVVPGLEALPQPAWSPNGRKIVFTLVRDGEPFIAIVNRNGKGLRVLTRGWDPDWQPLH